MKKTTLILSGPAFAALLGSAIGEGLLGYLSTIIKNGLCDSLGCEE